MSETLNPSYCFAYSMQLTNSDLKFNTYNYAAHADTRDFTDRLMCACMHVYM